LNRVYLKPLVGYPSQTTSLSTTSTAFIVPKMLDSAQDSSIEACFEIRSVGIEPFDPIVETRPFGPISSTWSFAALESSSDHLNYFTTFCVLRNSIAST